MASLPEIDLKRLWESMEKDRRVLQAFRTKRLDHVSHYVGSNYGENVDVPESPLNLLSLYVRVIIGHLVGSDPRVMASTFKPELRRDVAIFQDWMNKKLVRSGFADTLRKSVLDALFLVGITRIAITAPAEARFGGYGKKAGEPRISSVDFEDFVFDTRTRCFDEAEYQGHRYEVLYEDVRRSTLFARKPRLQVVPVDDKILNEDGDEKIQTLTRNTSHHDRYEEKVELWEVYIRKDNVVVTFDANGQMDEPLLKQKWIGPESGPYQFCSFMDVPGNPLPKGPIMDLYDLARSVNHLWRKVDNQASRARKVTVYRDSEDAKKMNDAHDGDFVQSNTPGDMKELQLGTLDQPVGVWASTEAQLFSKHAGNLDALGGLATQADTLGQEKMISENASNLIRYMSLRVLDHAQKCMKSLGWFYWYNPREEMSKTFNPPGLPEYQVTQKLDPYDRLGKSLDDMDLSIDPYSMMHQTPQTKVMILDGLMKDTIIPLLPMFNQPGIADVLDAYIRMKAKFTNCPEMIELLEKLHAVQAPPQSDQSDTQAQQPGAPQETTRNYVRTSQSNGPSDGGQQKVLQQLLAGGQTNQGRGFDALMPRVA